MMKRLLCTSGVLLWLILTTAAQTTAVITGRITDRPVRKVSLTYWYDPGITPAFTLDTLLQRDSFYFRIPLPAGRPVFFYTDAGNGYEFYGLIRAGDSVRMIMEGDSLRFSGRGAVLSRALYNARREQERVAPSPLQRDARALADGYQRQLLAGNSVLAIYRDSLEAPVWNLARAHVLGEAAGKLVATLWKLPPAPDSTLEERQVSFYKEKILPALPSFSTTDTTLTAIRYLNYLLQKAEADYYVQHRYECNVKAVYEWLKTHYSGRLRDRLLAQKLMQDFSAGNPPEDQEWCVRDYLTIVQNNTCKEAIAGLYGKARKGLSKGNTAPAFSLTDIQGRTVSLDQLNGKVVLLHFYNGADPLLQALSEIKGCFDETRVTFVNICCNGTPRKELPGWLLNMNDQHRELLSQYNINKYPSLIVIGKNGKIYAVRPPDPATDHGTALTNIIYDALLQ
ncbi:redoxin domain-containing protein [Chitinophaga sp. 212800010-3]|uniref:TlpA family protein disulfide reductase n=1 Tax=unclassified Chitinophaga TaxID=2619133 RepID=UPI002DEEA265|nr:AhpC/TSA family protein [Chitinophaga sp. 212800010-3]